MSILSVSTCTDRAVAAPSAPPPLLSMFISQGTEQGPVFFTPSQYGCHLTAATISLNTILVSSLSTLTYLLAC
ncbi:hypothetical protein AOLI_G00186350 [Acnodon oligacanthus]